MRDRRGATAVEFGLVSLPYFVLIMGGLQLFFVLLMQQTLETTAESIGRQILTGTVQKQSLTQAQFVSLVCSKVPSFMNCKKMIVDVNVATTFSAAVVSKPDVSSYGQVSNTTVITYNPGTAGQIVVFRLLYELPVVSLPGFNLASLSFGANLLMATCVFKNEAYSS